MASSPFAKYCFKIGVTVMGFAEDFGHREIAGSDLARVILFFFLLKVPIQLLKQSSRFEYPLI